MADNSEPTPSQNTKYSVKFKNLWCNKFQYCKDTSKHKDMWVLHNSKEN